MQKLFIIPALALLIAAPAAAEEVHLQIGPGAGILNQEVQRLLAHLEAHERPLTVVLALAGEAVLAVEVAGVGHVEAQCLYHVAGALFKGPRHVR